MIKNVKLGADPELFLVRNGEIISAEGLIGGTKEEPKPISKKGHFIQEDNVMVEYNIPPVDTEEDFVSEHKFVLDYLTILANLQDGAKLAIQASGELDRKYLQSDQAKTFGCEPDFNAWKQQFNPEPSKEVQNGTLRTCGGHIHVGYKDPDYKTSRLLITAMDATLGLQSLLLDKDERRKSMYGNAGAMRLKNYGVEYRTLSNFWIETEDLTRWAYNTTMDAIELVNTGVAKTIKKKFGKDIQKAINKNNKKLAQELLAKIEILVKSKELITK